MEASSGELPQILCLLRDSVPLEQEALDACFDSDRFARKTNPAQEEAIASQWRRASRANPRLFNGSKFRYSGVHWTADRPQLLIGLTSYREHVGTNLRSGQRLLQEAGSAVYGDRQAFLADPLAVGALLLTSDNRLVLVRRALWVGEYPGRVDRPGGHAEPDELPRPASSGEQESDQERHEAALSEVFESVRREVRDELGIPMTHLSRAYLAGILRDRELGGRPTLEFILRCSLPSSEVERLYSDGKHCEADESLGLVFLTREELFSEQRAVFRIPSLADLDVEYPGRTPAPPNGTADTGTGTGTGTAPGGDAGGEESGVRSEGAVTVDHSGEIGEARVNCDGSASSEPMVNCVSAASAASAASGTATDTPEVQSQVSGPTTVDGKADSAADPPPPAAKPRQQPPKKRRRNRKDKRGAAARAEAAQSAEKAGGPSPAPEPIPRAESAAQDTVQPPPETQSQTQTQTESATPQSGDVDSVQTPADCPGSSQRDTTRDAQTSGTAPLPPVPADGPSASATEAGEPLDVVATGGGAAEGTSSSTATATSSSNTAVCSSDAAAVPPEVSGSISGAAEGAGGDTDEIVVVQQNGLVLLKSGGEVTETTMPPSGQIETHAEVVNNPEGLEGPTGAATEEKTAEELEREKKAELWEQMTPGCKGALILLKAANLKGFVFRF